MQVTPENLHRIYQNLDLRFNQKYNDTQVHWDKVATKVTSTTKENTYPMRNILPRMREWVGERVVQNATAYEYTIRNKKYESTISVKADDIEDDNIGLYGNEADSLGEAAKVWPDEILFDMLMRGEELPCYDGQSFFDSDHPVSIGKAGSGVQSNVFEVPDLSAKSLASLQAAAGQWVNERGDALDVMMDTLVIPGTLDYAASLALGSHISVNGATIVNPMAAAFDKVPVPRLNKKADEFYLMMTSKSLKPLIFQSRKEPMLVSKDQPTDDNSFWRDEYVYGVKTRGNVGFGLWFMAIKAKIVPGAPLPVPIATP